MGGAGIGPPVLLGISFLVAVSFAVLLFVPHNWQVKSTLIWDFNAGLYNVKVSKAIGGHMADALGSMADSATGSKKAQKLVNFFTEGEGTIQEYKDKFCMAQTVLPVESCTPWSNLMIGSWVMLFTTIITALLLFSGAALYWHYYSNQSVSSIRKWALGCFFSAPCVAFGGCAVYMMCSMSFSRWLTQPPLALGVPGQSNLTIGITCVFAFFFSLLSLLPGILCFSCGKNKEAEYFTEGMENYPGYGAMQDPGYGQGYDQGYGQDYNQGYGQDAYAQGGYPAQQQYPPQQQYGQYPQQGY